MWFRSIVIWLYTRCCSRHVLSFSGPYLKFNFLLVFDYFTDCITEMVVRPLFSHLSSLIWSTPFLKVILLFWNLATFKTAQKRKEEKIGQSNWKSKTKGIYPFCVWDKLMCSHCKLLIQESARTARDKKDSNVSLLHFSPLGICFCLSLLEWTVNSVISKTCNITIADLT